MAERWARRCSLHGPQLLIICASIRVPGPIFGASKMSVAGVSCGLATNWGRPCKSAAKFRSGEV